MVFQGLYEILLTGTLAVVLAIGWAFQDRRVRPIVALSLMCAVGLGLSAAKVVPVLDLMREHPRLVPLETSDESREEPIPDNKVVLDHSEKQSLDEPSIVHGSWGEGTRWERVAVLLKAFLGRHQRAVTQYFSTGWLWHEYGAYLGPLGALLVVASPFLCRDRWPWIASAAFCFLVGLGRIGLRRFSWVAPFKLLHFLPLFRSMHCPSRFFIPALFAGCIVAGFALENIRKRAGQRGPHAGRSSMTVRWFIPCVVLVSLVDSVLVGRRALQGTFDVTPPLAKPRTQSLVTVAGHNQPVAPLMLANRAVRVGYEPLHIRARVHSVEQPGYRGEHFFVSSQAGSAGRGCQTRLISWSPDTVSVQVECTTEGYVVLNRNWDKGWRAGLPYEALSHDGLVAVRVPPGAHMIRFSFQSSALQAGVVVSLITLAGSVVCITLGGRWCRKLDAIEDSNTIVGSVIDSGIRTIRSSCRIP